MRKTSRIWRAPARGLPRVRMARLLAVVLAVVTAVVLAVVLAVVTAVVLAVSLAVVLAVFTVGVVFMVWLVSELSGIGVEAEGCTCSIFTDDFEAVRLTTMRTLENKSVRDMVPTGLSSSFTAFRITALTESFTGTVTV